MTPHARAEAAVAEGFAHGMFQHRGEVLPFAAWIYDTVRPARILEIGMHTGGSSRMFCHLASRRVVGVDLPDGPWGGLDRAQAEARNAAIAAAHPHFVGVLGDSRAPATIRAVHEALEGQAVDLLFIDGDHSYLGVQHDYVVYRAIVRPGGWIAFHDIADTRFHRDRGVMVNQLWAEIVATGAPTRTWMVGEDWGGIGAVQVL